MLGIFGRKSDHPLADIKSAQQILEDVPKNDAFNAVQELTGWIETIVERADDFRLDHAFAVLGMLDEAAQPHVRKLLRDYFSVQPLSKFQENRLWTALNGFYTQSELAHHDVLMRYRDGKRGASGIKSELALLGARGIAALAGRLKFAVARYALVEPALWNHLADFYSHAEANGYANDAVTPYPVSGNTSVAQEFAVSLAWYGVSAGTQSPLQEHITERLVAHVGNGLSVNKQFDGACLFVFDMVQPTPPMRATADFTVHPSMRFLGTAEALKWLSGLFKTLDKGIVPNDLDLCGAKYDVEQVRDVLQRLIENLTQPLPTRRNPRRKINVNLKVANGFFKMLEQTELGLNFNHDGSETWEVEDISATGFRSVVPVARAGGVKIGSLVGSKPENVQHWGAGIVRRLSLDEKNNLHIGVEVLSMQIVGVSLTDRIQMPNGEAQVALYLNRPADTSGEAWLLMKPDTFSANRSLNMVLGGKSYLLLPLALVESGDDYDLAHYRCMEQDTSPQ
jgi:hypothetical protein